MISDTLFEAARDIDRYLSDWGTTDAYRGEMRARIVNLRAEMDAIRAVLDTPPKARGDDDAS
jgi:hypothetical protein